MTTEMRVRRVADPFSSNEVLKLPREGVAAAPMAAVVWLTRGPPHDAHVRAFRVALALVHARFVDYALWALVGHSTPQPDTRWIHSKKLWESLRSPVPSRARLKERLVTGPDGPRYFSAALLDSSEASIAVELLEEERASCVVAVPDTSAPGLEALVARGWEPRRAGPGIELLNAVCEADGLVLWPVGEFDDLEGGVALVTGPTTMNALLGQ